MTNTYRVQALIWVEAESASSAADEVFAEIAHLTDSQDNHMMHVEVENDGELMEEPA